MSFTVFASRLARLRSSGLLAVLLQKDDAMPGEQSFAFTPQELVLIQMIGIIERSSVRSVTNSALREAIRPYAMSADTWQRKISAMIRSDGDRPAG